jgi:serine/threonine protein kinase
MSGHGVFATDVYDQERRLGAAVHTPVHEAFEEPVTPGMLVDEAAFAASLPAPGTRIGQYEIIRELGRGGMGAVYAARDTKLGRRVAIKFLYSDHQPELTARFILEAKATARCSHENIIVIH